MIVGAYLLHLYCDFEDDEYTHRGSGDHPGPGFEEIGHLETLARAKREARRLGWKFSGDRCICPYCVDKGRKLPPLTD